MVNKKIKYIRKHFMTLIELLVALSILSILLTVIFSFFRELSIIDEHTKSQQTQAFHKRYVEFRLNYLFSRLVNEHDIQKKSFFFLDPPDPSGEISPFNSLVFTYHNGVRLNPSFSGDQLARLYVNTNNQLCLVSWPNSHFDDPPYADIQKEILLENVTHIKFDFFAAPAKSFTNNPSVNGPNRGAWQSEWLLSYKQIPSLLKIILTIKNQQGSLNKKTENLESQLEDLEFIFYLPVSKASGNFIYYKTPT